MSNNVVPFPLKPEAPNPIRIITDDDLSSAIKTVIDWSKEDAPFGHVWTVRDKRTGEMWSLTCKLTGKGDDYDHAS